LSGAQVLKAGIAAALALLAGSCAPAAPFAAPPRSATLPRVVSLNPCTDAILAEVADPPQILAISHYSKDPRSSSMTPANAARFPATRGSVEEVLALQPDLVLGTSFTDPAAARAYDRLGLRLERLGIARNVAESRTQIRQIAALVGHAERGEALIARIDRALAQAAPTPHAVPVPAVVWQSGGIVPGSDALIVELMKRTGFANYAAQQGLGQADFLSLEAILAHPPQVLFMVREGADTGESSDRLRFHPALDDLGRTQRERLDARFLYCGGPTIITAVTHLAAVRRGLSRSEGR
jgi:iron complex transport system substrate-binding protein